jgi:hypothetical protein
MLTIARTAYACLRIGADYPRGVTHDLAEKRPRALTGLHLP